MMINALLLSNSTMPGTEFFSWPRPWVKEFLLNSGKRIVFVPFAAVTITYDDYTAKVREVFRSFGFALQGLHEMTDGSRMLEDADAIVVGGGNTFALLKTLYDLGCLETIRRRVAGGTPYVGWSAGSNLACPTIMTTNDMPVVQPPSLNALALVPFQINPHYHELRFEGQGGETRKDRLEEFLVMNPEKKVLGLPEGMLVRRSGDKLWLLGEGVAKLYTAGKEVEDLKGGTEISFLIGPGGD